MKRRLIPFSPLHGLASLGAGGLAISFFVWLLAFAPLGGLPVPTAEQLQLARQDLAWSGWIDFWVMMLALLALAHYSLLIWWFHRSRVASHVHENLYSGEAHIFRLLTPLLLAMSINVTFVVGLVFVPGLWSIKEWLFPFALLGFAGLLLMALTRWQAQRRLVKQEGFTYQGKGLVELFTAFALGMIAVGFSASAAMSEMAIWHTIGTVMAIMTGGFALVAVADVLRIRVRGLMGSPTAATATGSLLIGVPILTILGIAAYRLLMAGKHHFEMNLGAWSITALLATIFLTQLLIFIIVTPKLIRHAGWQTLVKADPQGASFSLICPGVGLFVLGMFLVSKGLLATGLITATLAMGLFGLLALIQIATLGLFVYLLLYAMPTEKDCAPHHANVPNQTPSDHETNPL